MSYEKIKVARIFYDEGGGEGGSGGGGSLGGDGGSGGADGGGGGSPPSFDPATDSFRQFLPEEIRGNFDTVPNLEALANGYLAAQKMIGVPADQIIRKPVAGDAESMTKALRALGAPEAVEGYGEIAMPEGVKTSPEFMKAYLGVAQSLGFLPHQVTGLATFMGETIKASQTEIAGKATSQKAAWQAELATAWGMEAGSEAWNANMGMAADVVERFAGSKEAADKLFDALEETGMADHPVFLQTMARVGAALQGVSLEGTAGGNDPGNTATGRLADLQAQAADLQEKINEAMNNFGKPGAADATALSERRAQILAEIEKIKTAKK